MLTRLAFFAASASLALFVAADVACRQSGAKPEKGKAEATQGPAPKESQAQKDPFAAIPRVGVEELRKALKEGKAVVVDVREVEAFEEEHIAGALSIPEDEVRARAGELPKDKLVVTYCA